jgi:hypothetical protein
MMDYNEIIAKDEINKAIGVLKARLDYLFKNSIFENLSEDEFNALNFSIGSLERWCDEETIDVIPDEARQLIWFKQAEQFREKNYQ